MGKKQPADDSKEDEADNKVIESLIWYSLESALSISNKALHKGLRGKAKKFLSLFYSLQILEGIEDFILASSKDKTEEIVKAIQSVKDEKSDYYKAFVEIKKKVRESGQFKDEDMM